MNRMIQWVVAVYCASLTLFASTVTITNSVDGGGMILGVGTYESGAQVTLKAVPQIDWQFDHWEGVSESLLRQSIINVTASANLGIKCVFTKNEGSGRFKYKNANVIGWSYQTDVDWGKAAIQIPNNLGEVVQLAAGGGCSFALTQDGVIIGWGSNVNHQLDIPSKGKIGFSMITASPYHCIAVRNDGTSVGWGAYNGWGASYVPPGLGMSNDAVGAAVGEGFQSFILLKSGGLYGWGNNRVGGDGGIFVGSAQAPSGVSNIVSVACGAYHNIAIRKDGNLIAWGWNSFGQTNVPSNIKGVESIAAGESFSVVLQKNGEINGFGSIDQEVSSGRWEKVPMFVPKGVKKIVGISSQSGHIVALQEDGTVVAWGRNNVGQATVPDGLSNIVSAVTGSSHTLALKCDTLSVFRDVDRKIVIEKGQRLSLFPRVVAAQKYQWHLNGYPINGKTNSMLFEETASDVHSGTYQLMASNGTESILTSPCQVLVVANGMPKVLVDGNIINDWGRFGDIARLELSSSLNESQILYTLDGSEPSFESKVYLNPLLVSNSVVVRAMVVSSDFSQQVVSNPINIQIVPTFSLSKDVKGSGWIETYPDVGRHLQDQVIAIRAKAEDGSRFLRWEGDLVGSFPERNVAMTRDKSIRAVFEPIPRYALMTLANGGFVTGGGSYFQSSPVNIGATPLSGWSFIGWSGDYFGSDPSFGWVVEGPASFSANFGTTISNVATGSGQIVLEPALPLYPYGTEVRVIPVPNPGSYLALWGGVGTGQPRREWIFKVTNATPRITALFQALPSDKAVLTASSTFGGRVTQSALDGIYVKGSSVVLTPVADTGYEFTGWSGDASGNDTPIVVVLDSSKTIKAGFQKAGAASYQIKIAISGPGSVRRVPDLGAYELGREVDLVAEAGADSSFMGWRGGVTNSQKRIRLTINGPVTVDALFRPIHPVLTEVRGEGQVLLSPPDGKYIDGTDLALTAKPAEGWGLVQWSGDLSTTSQEASLKVDAPKRVVAEFARLGTLTTKTVGSGSVSRTPDAVSYLPGTSVTLLATPAAGWKFLKWSGGASGSNPQLAVVMGRAEAIVAEFGDGEAPVLTVEQPQSGATRDERFGLKGKCSDNLRLASLSWTWNGVPQGTVPMSDGVFDLGGLTLQPGTNRIVLEAQDVAGNSTRVDRLLVWTPWRSLAVRAAAEVQEGQRLGFPITLDSPGDVAGLTFQLDYDPVWLTDPQWEWGGLVGQSVNTLNTATNGQVWATFSLPGQALPVGTQPIATVSFRARSVPEVREVDLKPSIRSVSGLQGNALSIGNAALAGTGRIKPRRLKADNNANQRLDIGDAVVVARLQVGLEEARAWDVGLNDLNTSGNLDNGDVVKALRAVVGLDPQPSPGSEGKRLAAALGLAKVLGNTNDVMALELVDGPTATVGQPYRVAMRLSRLKGSLSGLSFAVKYPASLTLTDKQVGALVPGDALPFWNESSGQVSLAAIRSTAWPTATGVAAVLTFVPTAAFTGQAEWPLSLEQSEITGSGFDVRPVDPVSVVIQSSGGSVDNRPQITLQPPKADGSLGLEIRAPAGATIAVETTSDLNAWTETQRVTAQGTGSPVKVTLQADPNVQAKFWRVRVR